MVSIVSHGNQTLCVMMLKMVGEVPWEKVERTNPLGARSQSSFPGHPTVASNNPCHVSITQSSINNWDANYILWWRRVVPKAEIWNWKFCNSTLDMIAEKTLCYSHFSFFTALEQISIYCDFILHFVIAFFEEKYFQNPSTQVFIYVKNMTF